MIVDADFTWCMCAQVRPNTLAPALARLGGSTEFSLEGYRQQLGIPQLVRACPFPSALSSTILP
jgi:hypothetical protein